MEEIQVTARCKIHKGMVDAFKAAAKACMQNTREMDEGTLQYDWFIDKDQTECVVRETYRDSEAVLNHVKNMGDKISALLMTCDIEFEIYGDVSSELRKLLENFPHKIYGFYQGL